ncbi:MAG: FliA/WhiG family RNA polymerase sigma factor [Deltaproteobacteria bacterium]|nr:FliA/WhiG family RNA polymerase sigma factor [Deltaproteobacteria bacterium]
MFETASKREQERRLLREDLITEYLPYVKRIVNRMAIHLPPSVGIDDLTNAAIIGLIEATESFDPTRGNKFMTYAIFRIKGAVLSELRTLDYHSRSNRRKIKELESAYVRLEHKWGREASEEEVAEELGITLDDFYEIRRMASISFMSLDEFGCKTKNEKEKLFGHFVNDDNCDALTALKLKEMESALAEAIGKLAEKERAVITLYYWEELTMKEIGEVLGITESRVSQLHSQAVIHLRAKLKKIGLLAEGGDR